MNPELQQLINELPPEHTCKDARSLGQIYEDNIQHEHKKFMANVDSTLTTTTTNTAQGRGVLALLIA